MRYFAELDERGDWKKPHALRRMDRARPARASRGERGLQPGLSRRDRAAVPRRRRGQRASVDLASANEIGIHEFDESRRRSRSRDLAHRAARRTAKSSARATVATSTAASARIPARWQAFHLAFELATTPTTSVSPSPRRGAGPHRMAGPVRSLRAEGAEARAEPGRTTIASTCRARASTSTWPTEQFVEAAAGAAPGRLRHRRRDRARSSRPRR